ncbi:phospholipase effector Tle1 domain-containing protein [Bradyrhizobium sp.]|uniref:phospholipase effector Tle1 domain-containing protein n=1 Tax=Bradyrhizobium sp. TaxID=376 RepID=UPI003FA5BE05
MGALGLGLLRDVIALYKFSCRNDRNADDELFGFSRGAFTIRTSRTTRMPTRRSVFFVGARPLLWCAAFAVGEYCDAAVRQQALREGDDLAIRLNFFSSRPRHRYARFYPAMDVLRFLGLLHITRPSSPQ